MIFTWYSKVLKIILRCCHGIMLKKHGIIMILYGTILLVLVVAYQLNEYFDLNTC